MTNDDAAARNLYNPRIFQIEAALCALLLERDDAAARELARGLDHAELAELAVWFCRSRAFGRAEFLEKKGGENPDEAVRLAAEQFRASAHSLRMAAEEGQ